MTRNQRSNRWTEWHKAELIRLYEDPKMGLPEIAEALGRTEKSVRARAASLGICFAKEKRTYLTARGIEKHRNNTKPKPKGNTKPTPMPVGAVKAIEALGDCKTRTFIHEQRRRGLKDATIARQLGLALKDASQYGLIVPQGPSEESENAGH